MSSCVHRIQLLPLITFSFVFSWINLFIWAEKDRSIYVKETVSSPLLHSLQNGQSAMWQFSKGYAHSSGILHLWGEATRGRSHTWQTTRNVGQVRTALRLSPRVVFTISNMATASVTASLSWRCASLSAVLLLGYLRLASGYAPGK